MKKVIVFTLLVLNLNSVFADCTSNGMWFFPTQKNISLNSMFIIQGYATSMETIQSFNSRKVYLESDSGELIELQLQEIITGQMRISQAIFKPVKQLKSNTSYSLKYANQTESESREMLKWNDTYQKNMKMYWETSTVEYMNDLSTDLTIEYEKSDLVHLGCGPSVYVLFDVRTNYSTEIWYKTEVVDLTTNKTAVFYITEIEKKLGVGHNMCFGAFKYYSDGKYKIRFTAMNTDGNQLSPTNYLIIDSPMANKRLK